MEDELIKYIAENLVNDPAQVSINRKDNGRTVVLELTVASEDMGRVIGKSGRVANAMRSLLRALTEDDRHSKRVILEIE
jgi:uncharacterized protein